MTIAQAAQIIYGNQVTSPDKIGKALAVIRAALLAGWKFTTKGSASFTAPNTKHAYNLDCVAGTVADVGRLSRQTVNVLANNSTVATRIAEKAGYYVCDCNMVG